MPFHPRIGSFVKQYGRFRLHVFEVYKGNMVIATTKYAIVLDDGSLNGIGLGTIDIEKSDLSGFLDYLHEWQEGQFLQLDLAKQWQSQTPDFKTDLDKPLDWKIRYDAVMRALREIEPNYQLDEAKVIDDFLKRPIWTDGPIVKRYGRFILRERIGRAGEQVLIPTEYSIFLSTGPMNEGKLGGILITESKFSDVLKFLHNWLSG